MRPLSLLLHRNLPPWSSRLFSQEAQTRLHRVRRHRPQRSCGQWKDHLLAGRQPRDLRIVSSVHLSRCLPCVCGCSTYEDAVAIWSYNAWSHACIPNLTCAYTSASNRISTFTSHGQRRPRLHRRLDPSRPPRSNRLHEPRHRLHLLRHRPIFRAHPQPPRLRMDTNRPQSQ